MNQHQYYQETVCIPQHLQQDQYHNMIHNNNSYQENNHSGSSSMQWPTQMAHQVTDSIQSQVQTMFGKSRLLIKSNGIQFVNPSDVIHRRVLGQGAFSQVNEVQVAGQRLACKHLKADLMQQPQIFRTAAAELVYEAHMLSSMDHPHILKIHGWTDTGIAAFDTGRHDAFFLLLDMLDETLDHRIQTWNNSNNDSNSLLEKLRVLTELASALHYVHEQGIVFRDLKPDNIGFQDGSVKLFDFGLSRELPTLDTTTLYHMSGKVGTIRYMAPEVVLHQPYNVSADVYSWSMVAFEVLTGLKAYDGWTPDLHAEHVCRGGMRPNVAGVRDDLSMLLQQTWHSDPTRRPTLPQIMFQLQQITMSIQAEQQQQRFLFEPPQVEIIDLTDSDDTPVFVQHFTPTTQHCQPPKLTRFDSIATIETASMSEESLDWL